jgi:secreted PhoX family phosphatase
MKRRTFLKRTLIGTVATLVTDSLPFVQATAPKAVGFPFEPIAPSSEDELILPRGFQYQVIRAWGDTVTSRERFGFNCDFTAFLPLRRQDSAEGLLWVNHEYTGSLKESSNYGATFARVIGGKPTLDDLKLDVGGSVLHIRQNPRTRHWEFVDGSRYNRRITASPSSRPELLNADGPAVQDVFEKHNIDGLGRQIHGTLQNCGGALTPWGSILSCEENFQDIVPEPVDFSGKGEIGDGVKHLFKYLGSKYGWVVEVDPLEPQSTPIKHTTLGRFRHENVAVLARDGKPVVCYMAEDRSQGHVWKFVSRESYHAGAPHRAKNKSLLSEGRLFVARFEANGEGRWIALDLGTEVAPLKGVRIPKIPSGAKKLGEIYTSPGALLVDAYFAANLAGATPMPHPEDVEIHPLDGSVYIAITAGNGDSDLFKPELGQICKLSESGDAPESRGFQWSHFSTSGDAPASGGYANPDNLLFDSKANLWVVTDIFTNYLNDAKRPAGRYQNNGLFVIPTAGNQKGKALQFASGPCECEMTGPSFTPDETTLFLSVQHPGETNAIRDGVKVKAPQGSNWPSKKLGEAPRPAVIAIGRSFT